MENLKRFITADYFGEEVLKYNLEPHEVLNTFKYEMSTSNRDLPLVQMQCEYVNGCEAFIYKVANRVTLMRAISDEPQHVLLSLFQGINELSLYHIGLDDLVLDESLIFYKPSSKKVEFVFLPVRDVKTGSAIQLRQVLTKLIKMPCFSKNIAGDRLAAIFELLYAETTIGLLLINELKELIYPSGEQKELQVESVKIGSPKNVQTKIADEKRDNHIIKDVKPIKPSKLEMSKLFIGIYIILAACGGLIWVSPFSFEGKLGFDLVCIAVGLLIYQKSQTQAIPKHKMTEVKPKKVKEIDKVKAQIAKPVIIPEQNFVNEITGEINEVKHSTIKASKDDKTVFLSEENETFSLCIDDAQNKIFNLQSIQTIGRNNGVCQITLEHMSVGRIHAEIHLNQGHIYIKDLNSMNGTFVNQQKIKPNEYIEIKLGDQIKFGDVRAYLR